MPADPRAAFLDTMAELPAGVIVVTAAGADGAPLGATVSAGTSLSLEPALILVCLARSSRTCQALATGAPFAVHLLRDGQEHVARALARTDAEKFRDVGWAPDAAGVPALPDCAARLACSVDALVPGGDHVIVIGAVRAIERGGGTPLLYHRRRIGLAPVELAHAG